jgi:hypothetical protein
MENKKKVVDALDAIRQLPKVNSIINKYEPFRITSSSNYPTLPPIIKLADECIGSAGEIVTVSGVQKSGKSAFLNTCMVASLSQNKLDSVPPEISVEYCNGKAILHIDTEQPKPKHLRNLKNIAMRIGQTELPENFHSYNVKSMERREVQELLEKICPELISKYGGIHMIILDGAADLINDVNDADASNELVKLLMKIADEYKALILAVVHKNPNDGKVRGHLGSELLRKQDAGVAMKKTDTYCYLVAEDLRNGGSHLVPQLKFEFDKYLGYHVCTGLHEGEYKPTKADKLKGLAIHLFKLTTELSYTDLCKAIMNHTNTGMPNAKAKCRDLVDSGLIQKLENSNYALV